jgi:hypothetical protein
MRGEYSYKALASQLYILLFGTSTNIQLFTLPGIGIKVDGAGIGICHCLRAVQVPEHSCNCTGLGRFVLVLDFLTFAVSILRQSGTGIPASGTVGYFRSRISPALNNYVYFINPVPAMKPCHHHTGPGIWRTPSQSPKETCLGSE